MSEEMKKGSVIVRSFRVTEDVMGKFKEVQDETGLTQDGVLKMLISSYELEKAKNMIPDRETEIANFQTKANELMEAFLHSLQLNQDAEARIRNDYIISLQSKDATIAELQWKVKVDKDLYDDAVKGIMEEKERRKFAEQKLDDMQGHIAVIEKSANDKAKIADMLQGKLAEAEEKLRDYPALKKSEAELKTKVTEVCNELQAAKKDAEILMERAVAAIQKEKDAEILRIEKEHSQEIQKLRDKIEALQDDKATLKDTIAELKESLAKMSMKLEMMERK